MSPVADSRLPPLAPVMRDSMPCKSRRHSGSAIMHSHYLEGGSRVPCPGEELWWMPVTHLHGCLCKSTLVRCHVVLCNAGVADPRAATSGGAPTAFSTRRDAEQLLITESTRMSHEGTLSLPSCEHAIGALDMQLFTQMFMPGEPPHMNVHSTYMITCEQCLTCGRVCDCARGTCSWGCRLLPADMPSVKDLADGDGATRLPNSA